MSKFQKLMATGALLLAGCNDAAEALPTGGDQKAEAAASPAATTPTEAAPSEAVPAEKAEAGWSALKDPALQAQLKKQVSDFFDEYSSGPFGLMFVDKLDGNDHRTAAGQLAFDKGMPATVIAIDQKEIYFVGDEAFTPDAIRPITKAMAAKFDKGDYKSGIDTALIDGIFQLWGFE